MSCKRIKYGFQMGRQNRTGKLFTGFMPAISNKTSSAIRDKIRECKTLNSGNSELPDIARELNPKLRGWKNYYGKFYKSKLDHTLTTATFRLARWAQKKYKKLYKKFKRALEWVGQYKNPSHYF